ncbi:MAG: energy transducer TonB [Porticoccaceae bacterium]|nr:energy transducer TonB [Porticoccaceae bacterium]
MDNFIDSPWNQTNERLKGTFSVALALHLALLLGLTFTLFLPFRPMTSMEVMLAHHASAEAPERADFLAQANQIASGNRSDKVAEVTSNILSEFQTDQQSMTAAQRQDLSQQANRPILAARNSPVVAPQTFKELQSNEALKLAQKSVQEVALQRSIGAMRAKINQLNQTYSNLPKVVRLTSASTKTAQEAAYMNYFEERIERVGNLNYPREARGQRLVGRVQLIVVILPDGSVDRVQISTSSGTKILDQAAVRSVQLASPFSAFPKELRDRDEIHVIRTWQYQADNLLTTN